MSEETVREVFLGFPSGFDADRDRQARKIDRLLGFFGFKEKLASPEKRAEFVDALNFDEFDFMLRQMNGALVNLRPSERHYATEIQSIADPDDHASGPIDVMPSPLHKEELLAEVLSAAQAVEGLEDKATILAVGINAVHPFGEGNGRVARGIYHLITEGFTKGDPKLAQLLSTEGEGIITPDPNFLRPVIMSAIQLKVGTHQYEPSTMSNRPRMITATNDPTFDPTHGAEEFKPPFNDELSVILLQEDFSHMLPPLFGQYYPESRAFREAVVEQNGQPYFLINKFWEHATDDDFINAIALFAEIKSLYVKMLLEQLKQGEESYPVAAPDASNGVEELPCAVAMKKVLKRQIDFSREVAENFLRDRQ